ncbi:MAG: single-stranded DNA-binding protein [Acidimicrobiales bacterium]
MNTVALVGRLTRDPLPRGATPEGPVAVLRLAVPRRNGNDDAVFVNVVCFDRLGAAALEHLTSGRRVAVTGRLEHREWTNDTGARRERHEVVAERLDWLDAPVRVDAGADHQG